MFGLHAMGEAQVDFGKVLIESSGGAEEEWHELVVSFPWSNAGFAQICRYETKECLCEALQRIFEFIRRCAIADLVRQHVKRRSQY